MATAATSSQGVTFKRGNSVGGASTVYTLIAEIRSISGPSENAASIDVTSLDSTAKEFIGGLTDGGEVSFEMNFVGSNAQQQGLRADLDSRAKRDFQLTLNDFGSSQATICTFTGVVTAFSMKFGVDNQVSASCTIKMSGPSTWQYAN